MEDIEVGGYYKRMIGPVFHVYQVVCIYKDKKMVMVDCYDKKGNIIFRNCNYTLKHFAETHQGRVKPKNNRHERTVMKPIEVGGKC